ncbi:hypothetical protein F4V91_27795 [Neorhizobium galegae]|uniref:Uncharacterized protein n=1 Tax=Neorhizobium galegae TaxID=399 RepID=A0A6A1TJD9_NEOGA|nr:hypothetical protein [Neorhizobium galegae]KAB1083368.1 hypothetical protein F4V91_27795 [Neorhizobium galegae]
MKRITGNRLGLSLLILLGWALIGWLAGPLLALVGEPSIDLGGISIPICGRLPLASVFCSIFDRIACFHMCGL